MTTDVDAIVGRAGELATIGRLVGQTTEGGGALLIRGDAGIGKSALLEWAVGLARASGIRVLRTTGVRTEANLPFACLHQLLHPILVGLDALPTPQRVALAGAFGLVESVAEDPFLVALATLTLLADAAAETPILVVADDAQWLDPPSADALAFVARRLGSDALTMVFGMREGDSSSIEDVGLETIGLQPLDEPDARAMVSQRAPGLPPSIRDRIVREAAGNPLALSELSATVRKDPGAGDQLPDVLPLNARLERAFAARADELPRETRWLVLVAALDDRDGVTEVLAAADVQMAALTPAVDARLIEVEGTSFRFRHPLIRSAIHQRATVGDRQRAHLALAAVVADPDRAAWHRAAATDGPDESVAALLDAAAERAIRRGAVVVAVDALKRAATLSEDGRTRGTRLLRAAEVANDIGRMDVIGRLLVESERIDVPALEDRRQAWITALAMSGPPSPREEANLRSVVASAVRAGDDGHGDLGLALLQFASARSWWLDPGVEIRSEIAAAAQRLASDPGDARVLFLRSIAPEHNVDELLTALSRRAASSEPISGIDSRRLAIAALWLGAPDLTVDFLTSAIADLRREGRLGLLARSLIIKAFASVHLGVLTTVASDLDEGSRLGVETGQPFYLATARVTQAINLAYRGDVSAAERQVGEVEEVVLGAPADGVLAESRHARGIIDLAAGRYDEAYEQLRHLFDARHASYHPTIGGWAIADFVYAAWLTDRCEHAAGILSGLLTDSERLKMPWWRIGVTYARAMLAADRGDSAAVEAAVEAARVIDLGRWPLARARLVLCQGVWLRRNRRVAESRAVLRSARDQFDAMGIRYLADRAQEELGASGDAARHRGVDALDQLTPQELQIARLAAEGLSNREIGTRLYLSHRTVGSHLYRVFPKLGVTSRSQLHRALSTTT